MTALQQLAATFNEQLESAGAITVDDAVLGTSGVDALIASSLGLPTGGLKVSVPSGRVPDPADGPLAFSGMATFLNLTSQTIALTFLLDGSTIVFDFSATPSGTWTFGTSYPDLTGTEFEALTRPSGNGSSWASFVFASFDESTVASAPHPTALAGMTFSAPLEVEGLFDVLVDLLQPGRTVADGTPIVATLEGVISLLPLTDGTNTSNGTVTRLTAALRSQDQSP